MFNGDKYKTIGVDSKVPEELQAIMWQSIAKLVDSDTEVDYLQIFKLSRCNKHKKCQLITHSQEQPNEYKKEIHVISESKKITTKIFVISSHDEDGNEYSTMMLAKEY
ncbi:MAG: DUF960 family protein [Clostridia bacterium]